MTGRRGGSMARMSAARTPALAERWVDAFREGWRAPADADSLIEHVRPFIATDARFVQPRVPDIIGPDGLRDEFLRPLLALIANPRGEVTGWAARGNAIYIDTVLRGSLAGKPLILRSCDRITLDHEGKCTERVANADPLDLAIAIATRPRSWPTAIRVLASVVLRRGPARGRVRSRADADRSPNALGSPGETRTGTTTTSEEQPDVDHRLTSP